MFSSVWVASSGHSIGAVIPDPFAYGKHTGLRLLSKSYAVKGSTVTKDANAPFRESDVSFKLSPEPIPALLLNECLPPVIDSSPITLIGEFLEYSNKEAKAIKKGNKG